MNVNCGSRARIATFRLWRVLRRFAARGRQRLGARVLPHRDLPLAGDRPHDLGAAGGSAVVVHEAGMSICPPFGERYGSPLGSSAGAPDARRRRRAVAAGDDGDGGEAEREEEQAAALMPASSQEVRRGDDPRPGVRAELGVAEVIGRHVRVDLRRRDARVAEHLLQHTQVAAAGEEVRRERVAQRVRTDSLGAARRLRPARCTVTCTDWRESRPPRALSASQGAAGCRAGARAAPSGGSCERPPTARPTRTVRVVPCRPCRSPAGAPLRGRRAAAQADEFADAQAAGVQQFEEHPVAQRAVGESPLMLSMTAVTSSRVRASGAARRSRGGCRSTLWGRRGCALRRQGSRRAGDRGGCVAAQRRDAAPLRRQLGQIRRQHAMRGRERVEFPGP